MNFTSFTNVDVQHAISLELLSDRLVEGATVLDVGSGSGYLTACMSIMVSDTHSLAAVYSDRRTHVDAGVMGHSV